jgi:hypothetical protein
MKNILPLDEQIKEWKESCDNDVRYYDGLPHDVNVYCFVISDPINQYAETMRKIKAEFDKNVINGVPGIARYMYCGKANAAFRRHGVK